MGIENRASLEYLCFNFGKAMHTKIFDDSQADELKEFLHNITSSCKSFWILFEQNTNSSPSMLIISSLFYLGVSYILESYFGSVCRQQVADQVS